MTIKHTSPPKYGPSEQFPGRPPRGDMQNSLFLNYPGYQPALAQHLGSLDTTLVISEMPIGRNLRQRLGLLYPDLLIAFNVDREEAIARSGFAIDTQGKSPDFVLEIASLRTADNDYTRKREGYAAYAVPEYWRFDPTGGRYYPAGLAGDRLVENTYQPIDVIQMEEGVYRGYSEVLNLELCWEHGQLRWYDPASESYIRTHTDEREGRIAAEAQRDDERQARIAAEADASQAQARVRELEDKLRRQP